MKEATGSTTMLYVLLIFLSVFITFIAVAFNYARAFKVKNNIIDIIERNEGIDKNESGADSTLGQIYAYLDTINYSVTSPNCTGYNYISDGRGFCIGAYEVNDSIGRGSIYYSVETFATIDFPLVELMFKIPIKGETRVITNEMGVDYSDTSIPTEIYDSECEECQKLACMSISSIIATDPDISSTDDCFNKIGKCLYKQTYGKSGLSDNEMRGIVNYCKLHPGDY